LSDDPDRRPEDEGPSWAPFGPGADDVSEPPAPAGDTTGGLWSSGDPLDAAPSPGPDAPPPAEPAPSPAAGPSPWAPPEAPRMDPGAQGWAPPNAPSGTWPPPATPSGTWPPAGAGGTVATGRTAGNATASLVLGIIGLFVCPVICSVAAIVVGLQARREIAATPGLGGRGAAGTGIALGVIGIAVFIVGLIVGFAGIAGSTL
jgi:hypothetical protein